MTPKVTIDCFPEAADNCRKNTSIVCIDIFRATTTAITALYHGRDVYPVKTTDRAFILFKTLNNAILTGEQGGNVPYGFHMTNSPVQIAALHAIPSGKYTDPSRPIILLSSSGTRLISHAAVNSSDIFIVCLRNINATAKHLIDNNKSVKIIGAGTRGQFRREDQICCAWLGEQLLQNGFISGNKKTSKLIKKWSGCSVEKFSTGRSADYLRNSGQIHDMEFTLHHINDLNFSCKLNIKKMKLQIENKYENC